MELHVSTQKGSKRKSNQDALSFNDIFINAENEFHSSELITNHGANIFILADGMGGYLGGDYASNYLIREIYKQFANNKNFNITKSLNSIDDE